MSSWNLYWLYTPDPLEDCFVIAKNPSSAKNVEYETNGTDFTPIKAEQILKIPQRIVERYIEKLLTTSSEYFREWPNYVDDWILDALGCKEMSIGGSRYYEIAGRLIKQADIGDVYFKNYKPKLAKSVKDIIAFVDSLSKEENWIFRGQSNALWNVASRLNRLTENSTLTIKQIKNYESQVFTEFKKTAHKYLKRTPKTDWEYIALAQHYGLPTRLLDWTIDLKVALYFAVHGNYGEHDAIFIAYAHSINPSTKPKFSPFDVKTIEAFHPPRIVDRIKKQKSIFTVEPIFAKEDEFINTHGKAVETLKISAKHIKQIRAQLQFEGYSQETLLPSLDALCADITFRHLPKKLKKSI